MFECQISHLHTDGVEQQVKCGCKCLHYGIWGGMFVSGTSQVSKGTGGLKIRSVGLSDNRCVWTSQLTVELSNTP